MNRLESIAAWTLILLALSFGASLFFTGIVGAGLGATTPASTVFWFWAYFLSIPTLILWAVGAALIYLVKSRED